MVGLLLVIVAATPPNPFLAEARVLFQAQDYARCLKRVEQAAVWKSTLEETAELELVRGLCLFGQGHEEPARAAFEKALLRSPGVSVPAWSSPRIREVFAQVRREQGLPPTPDSDAPTRGPTPEPSPVVSAPEGPPPTPPPAVAAAPSHRIGLVPPLIAGAVAVVAGGLGVGLGVTAREQEARSYASTFEQDRRAAALGARDVATASNASYGVAGAAVLTAAVMVILDLGRAP